MTYTALSVTLNSTIPYHTQISYNASLSSMVDLGFGCSLWQASDKSYPRHGSPWVRRIW